MSELRPVGQQPEATTGDIVFVHGLGGHWRTTWMADPHDDETFWPLWLARDLPTCRTWSLDYEADLSKLGGSVMDIEEHADTILEILKVRDVGARPVVFLAHSLGGLVTKALLRAALESKAEAYRRIADQTRGIVFFATPNSGARLASMAASLLWFLRPSPVLKDLRAHASALRKLNGWYRDQVTDGALGGREGVKVFYEKAGILRAPFLIVDETSADPGIPDVKPLALKADHWATCKLTDVKGWIYESVKQHVGKAHAAVIDGPAVGPDLPTPRIGVAEGPAGRYLPFEPPANDRFVGRDEQLGDLVSLLLGSDSRPVCVLGGPGIGKTNLTIAALHHQAIIDRFGDRRGFVTLETATDADAIWPMLARALRLRLDGGDAKDKALQELHGNPWLIVLDNLETPLDADRNRTEKALQALCSAGGSRILASYRAGAPPRSPAWRPLPLQPLTPPTDRELFLQIAGESFATDPDLDPMVRLLEGLPLAIELVALAAVGEPRLRRLKERWHTLLEREDPSDRNDSVHLSLRFSLKGPRMTEPGRRLFALLGVLPDGVAHADLDSLLPGLGADAARTLRNSGLVHDVAQRMRMLAPIRAHAHDREKPVADDLQRLIAHYLNLARAPMGERSTDHVSELRVRAELANIDAMIDLALPSTTEPLQRRDLAVESTNVGDTQLLLGGRARARLAYQRSLRIIDTLAAEDPGNTTWQRDRSVSLNKIGDVLRQDGDWPGALRAYRESLGVMDTLLAKDPGNTEWQRDRSVSLNKIGDVLLQEGDRPGALRAFRESLSIVERLVERDPSNIVYMADIAEYLGKLAMVSDDPRPLLERGREIVKGLEATEKVWTSPFEEAEHATKSRMNFWFKF